MTTSQVVVAVVKNAQTQFRKHCKQTVSRSPSRHNVHTECNWDIQKY